MQWRTNVLDYATVTAGGGYTDSFTSTGLTNILSGGTGGGVITNVVEINGATISPARYYRVRILAP